MSNQGLAARMTLMPTQARIAELEAERDEADRRAGAAERRLADLQDTDRKARWWMDEQKQARGYDPGVSFDTVWAETCANADLVPALQAEVRRQRQRAEEAERRAEEIITGE